MLRKTILRDHKKRISSATLIYNNCSSLSLSLLLWQAMIFNTWKDKRGCLSASDGTSLLQSFIPEIGICPSWVRCWCGLIYVASSTSSISSSDSSSWKKLYLLRYYWPQKHSALATQTYPVRREVKCTIEQALSYSWIGYVFWYVVWWNSSALLLNRFGLALPGRFTKPRTRSHAPLWWWVSNTSYWTFTVTNIFNLPT